jgi:predicted DNA-binding protein
MRDLSITEVVSIRLSKETKNRVQELADKEYRTFADQCRFILDAWFSDKKDKE